MLDPKYVSFAVVLNDSLTLLATGSVARFIVSFERKPGFLPVLSAFTTLSLALTVASICD